jgi:acetolactate synthase-1/2/3 large subunit
MQGAEALLQTALAGGIEVVFANPGTTEMPVVNALDRVGTMRAVLGLQENVVTGAADGYARMMGKPALTLLHLGPGFANGIANLHNARRARSSIINLIGEQATWHKTPDAPLTSDIESLAGPVSAWVCRSGASGTMAGDMAKALRASRTGAGGIATLILPHDLQLEEGAEPAELEALPLRARVREESIEGASAALRQPGTLLFIGNAALSEQGLKAAGRIAKASGAAIMSQSSNARAERGQGLPPFARLPYLPEMALAALEPYKRIVLAGAISPVAFFGWPGYPSSLVPLTAEAVTGTVAAHQQDGDIIVNESITSGWNYHTQSMGAPRFTELQITGGAIGCGPSLALGAAVAAPDRQVINIQADGSALYSPQAFWSQARENAKVITVIFSNKRYKILQMELERAGHKNLGPASAKLTDLGSPDIDWLQIAKGFGVTASRVTTVGELSQALSGARKTEGPHLIEAVI